MHPLVSGILSQSLAFAILSEMLHIGSFWGLGMLHWIDGTKSLGVKCLNPSVLHCGHLCSLYTSFPWFLGVLCFSMSQARLDQINEDTGSKIGESI